MNTRLSSIESDRELVHERDRCDRCNRTFFTDELEETNDKIFRVVCRNCAKILKEEVSDKEYRK